MSPGKLLGALAAVIMVGIGGCGDDAIGPTEPGGEATFVEVDFDFGSDEYLNNRFFRLDLPGREPQGRADGEQVALGSIKVFRLAPAGPFGPWDIQNMAAYVDSTGFRAWPQIDFAAPQVLGGRWTELRSYSLRLDAEGELVALDLGREYGPDEVLAVVYSVVDATGQLVARVGDDPTLGQPTQPLPGYPDFYYRMKLLKAAAAAADPYVHQYVLRNIYDLGNSWIDATGFQLRIEATDPSDSSPAWATPEIPWFRIFGLDCCAPGFTPGADGQIDTWNPLVFDFQRGLLVFPVDLPQPFAAPQAVYETNAASDGFVWEDSYLADHLAAGIYELGTPPEDFPQYRYFRIRGSYRRSSDLPLADGVVPLGRTDWARASAPVTWFGAAGAAGRADGRVFDPVDRVENVRWFLPKNRVLARYLDPALAGTARDRTVPALDLYLRHDDGWLAESWGGISSGCGGALGVDLSFHSALEFWVNDSQPEPSRRSGRVHIDVGWISEDGFWPSAGGELIIGRREREDGILPGDSPDGVWVYEEDIGLDGQGDSGPERFSAEYEVNGDIPFPLINGTARNNREDDEDLDGNHRFDVLNGYFTAAVDLATSTPQIDVVRDYPNVQDLVDANIAWRRYRVELADLVAVASDREPDLTRVTHIRLWFEDESRVASSQAVWLQFAGLRFVD